MKIKIEIENENQILKTTLCLCKPLESDLRHFNYKMDKVIDWIIKVARMSKYKATRHNQNQNRFQFWFLISVLKMSFETKNLRIEN